ncbi:MAG: NUDIX domain-containing protein [bacterium]|nr:NUDIX domain-containing protein [bacterium]
MEEYVVVIDINDNELGIEEKIKAHKTGKLHRAFSIVILDENQNLLIHKRNKQKYHCGELWTGPCCGHPRPGESYEDAAHRKLKAEMGFDCALAPEFSGHYKIKLEKDDLWEHEYGVVLFGHVKRNSLIINPHPGEVEDFRWISLANLIDELLNNTQNYTPWFNFMTGQIVESVLRKTITRELQLSFIR